MSYSAYDGTIRAAKRAIGALAHMLCKGGKCPYAEKTVYRVATGRFGKYGLPNAGTCNYGNFGDLPEIHQREMGDFS
jgi:hypothetical protein